MKSCKSHEKNETKNIRLLVFSFSSINLAFWCLLFCFFMWFARFQILICKPQSIWRKLLILSWLYLNVKIRGRFFPILWPSQNILTLYCRAGGTGGPVVPSSPQKPSSRNVLVLQLPPSQFFLASTGPVLRRGPVWRDLAWKENGPLFF